MSDDKKKKPTKQTFFRINSQGELTETEKTEMGPFNEKVEPNTIEPPEIVPIQEQLNEQSHQEPVAVLPDPEITNPGLGQEPKNIQLTAEASDDLRAESEPAKEEVTNEESAPPPIPNQEIQESGTSIEPSVTMQSPPIGQEDSISESAVDLKPELPKDQSFETLRNYISLKEKEVADLKEQQKQYQNVVIKLKRTQGELSQSNLRLKEDLELARANEQLIKKEMLNLREKHENEIAILKNDFDQQKTQNSNFQEQVQELNRQKNIWREKISEDLKKIKIKEKELENRYELLKRDTETLLDSKDQQILDLKKKIDAFELELESLEERLRSEHAIINSIDGKKRRLIETLKLAISLLEQLDSSKDISEERKTG